MQPMKVFLEISAIFAGEAFTQPMRYFSQTSAIFAGKARGKRAGAAN